MTAKETLWSVVLVIVFAGAVYFGNIAIDKSDELKLEYYDIVDNSNSFDYKICQFYKKEQILKDSIDASSRAAENFNRELLKRNETLTYEAYAKYRQKSGSAISYETYLAPIRIGISVQTREYNRRLSEINKMKLELDEHLKYTDKELPRLKIERERYNVEYSKQLRKDYDPEKNIYHSIMLACGAFMTVSFMILMKICPPLRYMFYSIAAIATVSHLTRKEK